MQSSALYRNIEKNTSPVQDSLYCEDRNAFGYTACGIIMVIITALYMLILLVRSRSAHWSMGLRGVQPNSCVIHNWDIWRALNQNVKVFWQVIG